MTDDDNGDAARLARKLVKHFPVNELYAINAPSSPIAEMLDAVADLPPAPLVAQVLVGDLDAFLYGLRLVGTDIVVLPPGCEHRLEFAGLPVRVAPLVPIGEYWLCDKEGKLVERHTFVPPPSAPWSR